MSKYAAYKFRAKKKDLEFDIPKLLFTKLEAQSCYYCKTKVAVGVDRVDNDQGYVSGNCIPCCWTCNRSKSDMNMREYITYLHRFNPEMKVRGNPLVVKWDEESSWVEPLHMQYKFTPLS